MTGIAQQGGAYFMRPEDYETGLIVDPLDPTTPVEPAPIDQTGLDLPSITPPEGLLEPTLTSEPAPLDPQTGLAPGTFVNIAIGIAIGIVIDRLFLK